MWSTRRTPALYHGGSFWVIARLTARDRPFANASGFFNLPFTGAYRPTVRQFRFAKIVIGVSAFMGASWGLILLFRAFMTDTYSGPDWGIFGVPVVVLTVGSLSGRGAGKWLLKRLFAIKNSRVLQVVTGPVFGAVAGAAVLVWLMELSEVLFFSFGVEIGKAVPLLTRALEILKTSATIGAMIGACTGLIVGIAVSSFPRSKRINLSA